MFNVSAFTFTIDENVIWDVITTVSKSFQVKGLFTMHVCNPGLKID